MTEAATLAPAWSYPHPPRGTCTPDCPSWFRCHCGCDERPDVAEVTSSPKGFVRGRPRVFVGRHYHSHLHHLRTERSSERDVSELIPHLVATAQELGGASLYVWEEGGQVRWSPRDFLYRHQTVGPARLIAKAWVIRYGGDQGAIERKLYRFMRGTVARVHDDTYDRLLTLRRSL